MLCFQLRDTGTCTVENCKYLHATKEEFAKLNVFMSASKGKGAKDSAATADKDATSEKKKKRKNKKGGGAAAAATDSA